MQKTSTSSTRSNVQYHQRSFSHKKARVSFNDCQ